MTDDDGRPPIWAGHIGPIRSHDLDRAVAFYTRLGLRPATNVEGLRSMEMRGGTHLVISTGDPEPGRVAFDFMVDDVTALHADLSSAGVDTSAVLASGAHEYILVTDPDGHIVRINDSHVIGEV